MKKISTNHTQKIGQIVKDYLCQHNVVYDGYEIEIKVLFKPVSRVTVTSDWNPNMLSDKASEVWWNDNSGMFVLGTKVYNILDQKQVTLFELVTMTEEEVRCWDGIGTDCVNAISSWLQRYGLYLGMVFSEEVKERYGGTEAESAARKGVVGLADLIRGDLD